LIATAKEKVAEFKAAPTGWIAGTEAFEPGNGKAAVMGCGSAAAICSQQADVAVDALHAMGWESDPPVDGQFSPQVEAGFIDRAVQDNLDGIILISVNVNTLKSSVERAVAAGLRITCVVCVSGDEWKGKVIDIGPSYVQQGEMAAWAIMAARGGDAKVATFVDQQFVPPQVYAKSLGDTLAANCRTCSFDPINFSGANAAKPGPPEWNAYLATHPEGTVTDVVGEYDALSLSISKTNANAGRTEIAVGGYNGDEPNLAAMVSGEPRIDFTVAYGYTYFSWNAADILGRWKANLPLPEGLDQQPNQLVEKDNAAELLKGNPAPSVFPAPEGDWQGNYKTLWGQQ
jgi:ABC-type sugar transport system substrate-binding protein